jgi:hypothetical protein
MLASIRSGFLFTVAALTLQGTVFATDYCPTSFYGYICGLYYYSCSYCDASNGCASGFVATATMHDTGGNFACCDANAGGCTDPITDGTLLSARQTPSRAAHRNLVLYVHSRQRDFIGEKDRFLRPGAHIEKKRESFAFVDEPNGTRSYFRLLTVGFSGTSHSDIYIGQEMDPDYPPKNAMPATRSGGHHQHTICVEGEEFDVTSVRDLPVQP